MQRQNIRPAQQQASLFANNDASPGNKRTQTARKISVNQRRDIKIDTNGDEPVRSGT